MKEIAKNMGLLMILAGVLTFAVCFMASLTDHNAILIVGLVLVIAGVVTHIIRMKRDGKY